MNCKILQIKVPFPEVGGRALEPDDLLTLQRAGDMHYYIADCGLYFLEQVMSGLPKQDIHLVTLSRSFWEWWLEVWMIQDRRLRSFRKDTEFMHKYHGLIHCFTETRAVFWENIEVFISDGELSVLKGGSNE